MCVCACACQEQIQFRLNLLTSVQLHIINCKMVFLASVHGSTEGFKPDETVERVFKGLVVKEIK